jgi:hypothetical protein
LETAKLFNKEGHIRRVKDRKNSAARQWLTPIILATQETGIRRIALPSQPGQIICEILPQKYLSQKGLVEWLKV